MASWDPEIEIKIDTMWVFVAKVNYEYFRGYNFSIKCDTIHEIQ